MDESLKYWVDYFKLDKPDLSTLSQQIKENDTYFLNHKYVTDFDDENFYLFYDCGLIEHDILKVLKEEDLEHYFKTRLAIFFFNNIGINNYRNKVSKKDYLFILESVFVKGLYQNYEIPSEKLIQILINNYNLPKNEVFDLCFLRGLELASEE